MLHNLSCCETRFRLLCRWYLLHSSFNLVFRQHKLCNMFIFGMAYLRSKCNQIMMLLTFKIFGNVRNHSKNFPKYSQTSFSGIVNCSDAIYARRILLIRRDSTYLGENVVLSLWKLMKTAIVRHYCWQRRFTILESNRVPFCVLTTRRLHYTTESIWYMTAIFSSALAEHNYIKCEFKKRFSDSWIESRTPSMPPICSPHYAREPILLNQRKILLCYLIVCTGYSISS